MASDEILGYTALTNHYSHHWGIVISEEICFSTEQVWQEAFKMMDNFDNRPQVRIDITCDYSREGVPFDM